MLCSVVLMRLDGKGKPMSLIPYAGMVDGALKLKLDATLWLGIGRTSAWVNESSPPAENVASTVLDQPIGYKKVEMTALVKPDAGGSIVFQGQNYSIVADNDAVAQIARYCYIKASLNYQESNSLGNVIGAVTFRQTGLFSGLVCQSGLEGETVLTPAQVQSVGRLVFLVNHTPRTRDVLMRDIIEILREFKA